MEKVPNQEEIDVMMRAARTGCGAEEARVQTVVELWDARRARPAQP